MRFLRIFFIVICLVALCSLAGCAKQAQETETETPQETEVETTAPSESGPDVFPFFPADPMECYPELYPLDLQFDFSKNNNSLNGLSIYLDPDVFSETPDEYDNFWLFASRSESAVGESAISVYSEPITDLHVIVHDKYNQFDPVSTLNLALDNFLNSSSYEIFTYFSEPVAGSYASGSMFTAGGTLGYVIYMEHNEIIYSIQILVYDGNPDQVVPTVIQIFSSIRFE